MVLSGLRDERRIRRQRVLKFKLTNHGAIFNIIACYGDYKRIITNRFAVLDYAGDSRLPTVD